MMKSVMKKSLFINLFIMAVICFTSVSVYAKSNIQFESTNVSYAVNDKRTVVVEGNFTNLGNNVATVQAVNLKVQCWDMNDNLCVNDNASFYNVNVTVRPGEVVPWRFSIHNSRNTGYEGNWKWHVEYDINSSEW